MTDAAWVLQEALAAALSEVLESPGLAEVYDAFPARESDRSFPYVTFGDDFARDFGSKSRIGTEHLVSIHIWSRSGDWSQVKDLSGRIHARLHQNELSLSSGENVMTRFVDSHNLQDSDGITRQGILRFRFFIAN